MKNLFALKNKKGQSVPITPLVMGIATLVVAIIVAFVIVSTLNNANLLTADRPTNTITNETQGWINTSTYTLKGEKGAETLGFTLTTIWASYPNLSAVANYSIALANVSLNTDTGVLTNTSDFNTTVLSNVSFSYTFQNYSSQEFTVNNMTANLTSGVNNISSKIPTVLVVAAIILIMGILGVLVGIWYRMRAGGGSQL